MKDSNAELLCMLLNEAWPNKWVSEYPAIQGRRFAYDVACLEHKILIEINGGLRPFWMKLKNGQRRLAFQGGHNSTEGIERDYEKQREAIINGWKPLTYTPETLKHHPYRIISDLWKIIGEPTGNKSMAMLEASLKVEIKKSTRRKISKVEGQQRIV